MGNLCHKVLFITKPADTLSINIYSAIFKHIYMDSFNDSKGFRAQNEFMIL